MTAEDIYHSVEPSTATNTQLGSDPINPPHYNSSKITPIDAIEDWGLGFCLGNAVKYIARAGKKYGAPTLQDLKKARWYLDREISNLEK